MWTAPGRAVSTAVISPPSVNIAASSSSNRRNSSFIDDRKPGSDGKLPPIDFHEIISLIAPRAFLDLSGLNDGNPATQRQRVLMLMLETGCLGVITARDIILFYIFFEFTLIPLFFLIGIWGSEERRYAAMPAVKIRASTRPSTAT